MIRIAMIGAGGIARSHADAITQNPDCTLTAVADIDLERAKAMAMPFGADYYTDYKEMDTSAFDAVIITLPHFLHCEASVFFLDRGIHVLCEKPMANTVEECDAMVAAAKRSSAKLAIGHVQKYYSAARMIRQIIEDKRYGALTMIRDTRCKDYLQNRPAWFLSKKMAGGGIAMNLGAHSIDRILTTTGLSVESACGATSNPVSDHDVETTAHILLTLTGGISATITLCGTHVPYVHETVFYFTDGVVKIDRDDLYVYENGEFIQTHGDRDLLIKQLAEFIKLIRGEESEICSPEYGREIIRVLKKIV